jgi:hypothetical protein
LGLLRANQALNLRFGFGAKRFALRVRGGLEGVQFVGCTALNALAVSR